MRRLPEREVSFAPTDVFARHWQSEVKAQAEKFNKPTWAVNTQPPVEVLVSESVNPLLTKEEAVQLVPLQDVWKVCGVIFLLGIGAGALICYYAVKR